MHQWNWCKTTGMAISLAVKYDEAVKMVGEQELAWLELDASTNSALTKIWRKMDTKPVYKNGKWTSVFLLSDTNRVSLPVKLKQLADSEISTSTAGSSNTVTAGTAAWIVEGTDLENAQQRILQDIKSWGSSITPRQSLELAASRKSLSSRLIQHRQQSLRYLPFVFSSTLDAETNETAGKPETLKIILPSSAPAKILKRYSKEPIFATEREVRRVACLKALQSVRTTAIQRAHLLKSKKAHARGIIKVTRAEGAIDCLTTRIAQYRAQYNCSREALHHLGPSAADKHTFRKLQATDLEGLSNLLLGKSQLGEGYVSMPWYWRVQASEGDLDSDEISISKPELRKQYEESIRVEWFRARERYKRWQEEVEWLQREFATTILDFECRAQIWLKLSEEHTGSGRSAYARRQARVWFALRDDAYDRGSEILKV
ncbi:hypothetical protein BDV93DRAFT_561517 [Ceratobasidium sp. AG-I]|nr:hypothetical protein BDV93DRAFT_561517 [Ceratobasidium sp. AG-I]